MLFLNSHTAVGMIKDGRVGFRVLHLSEVKLRKSEKLSWKQDKLSLNLFRLIQISDLHHCLS